MAKYKASSKAAKGLAAANSAKTVKQAGTVFLFDKRNYYLMIAGVALVILGFIFMTGAKVTDPKVFDYNEIYSFRRTTLAPIVIILGFVIEVFAIMLKPKDLVSEKQA